MSVAASADRLASAAVLCLKQLRSCSVSRGSGGPFRPLSAQAAAPHPVLGLSLVCVFALCVCFVCLLCFVCLFVCLFARRATPFLQRCNVAVTADYSATIK
jgi:hypothetical protein